MEDDDNTNVNNSYNNNNNYNDNKNDKDSDKENSHLEKHNFGRVLSVTNSQFREGNAPRHIFTIVQRKQPHLSQRQPE